MSDEGTPRPAYVIDARHGTTSGMAVGMFTPSLGEICVHNGFIKAVRYRLCHPIRKFLAQAKEDWDYYADKFIKEGFGDDLPYPSYPYTIPVVNKLYKEHMELSGEPYLACDAAD